MPSLYFLLMCFSIVCLLQIWSASRVSCWHYNDRCRPPFVRILHIECVLVPWYFVDWYLWYYCHVSVSVYHRHGDIETVCFYSFFSNSTISSSFLLNESKEIEFHHIEDIIYVKSCGNLVCLILSIFVNNGRTLRVWDSILYISRNELEIIDKDEQSGKRHDSDRNRWNRRISFIAVKKAFRAFDFFWEFCLIFINSWFFFRLVIFFCLLLQ